jgi:N-acetylmuramoyl-L-alanine amidase
MSANPTRTDWPAVASASDPLPDGNRVIDLIAREEAMNALLAFSGFHEQIRNRRLATGRFPDPDVFETERFIQHEVLQLICDRMHAITQADGIVVALVEQSNANGSKQERSSSERLKIICRAAAGPLATSPDFHLDGGSALLQECLKTGRILYSDDCENDRRVGLDFARQTGARSTVLIPLAGRRQPLGVLQLFSYSPLAFTEHDVRCFDLFAELILSALKPEDQDRRIQWLVEVTDEVLRPIPADRTPASFDIPQTTRRTPVPDHSRPGLSVVLGLVAVAALFSAGAWWGMEPHGRATIRRFAAANFATARTAALKPMTTSPAPPVNVPSSSVPSGAVSDNLMTPSKLGSETAPLSPVAEDKLTALPRITGLRHWSSSIGSTVVIDIEDQVPYEVHRLISPERIYFDLHDTLLAPELDGQTIDIGDPSLTRVRIAQPVAGVTRIVLDTRDGSSFSVSMESNPYRLVVELRNEKSAANDSAPDQASSSRLMPNQAVPKASPIDSPKDSLKDSLNDAASSQTPPSLDRTPAAVKAAPVAALAANASELSLPARALPTQTFPTNASPTRTFPTKSGKFRIVLDPGHGGWDLGTVGHRGLLEKDLVLDVTQRLGKLLRTRLGSEVMFTRTDDTYLPLEQRADFANHAQADLFVSVHANYSTSVTARGVETYYTNLFAAPGAKEVEKKADGSFAQPTPVSLSAGALHEKIEESRRLAASVQRSLYATLAAKSPDIRDRGIKDAAFVVLTGTTMPAILTEISFVSSPTDEHNLQSEAYRQQIAEALYKGIARYQESSPRAKVAQLQPVVRR